MLKMRQELEGKKLEEEIAAKNLESVSSDSIDRLDKMSIQAQHNLR